MPWKVKAHFHEAGGGTTFRTVVEADEWDDDLYWQIGYWIRNMEPGHKVVIRRSE